MANVKLSLKIYVAKLGGEKTDNRLSTNVKQWVTLFIIIIFNKSLSALVTNMQQFVRDRLLWVLSFKPLFPFCVTLYSKLCSKSTMYRNVVSYMHI